MIPLGEHRIGPGHPPFVIAECCNNFQESMAIAHEMVDVAKQCGAQAVKFQYPQLPPRVRRLSIGQLAELKAHADDVGLVFLCTAYDEGGVKQLDALVDAHKVGSAEVTDERFVATVASKHKPLFMSTGACSFGDVRGAVEVVDAAFQFSSKWQKTPLILMQCTSIYPTPPPFTALGVMETYLTLAKHVGYSDHTGNTSYPVAAMALGADAIEVHFTLSKALPGPDQSCSHEPEALAEICTFARNRAQILASSKTLHREEMEKISKFRKASA